MSWSKVGFSMMVVSLATLSGCGGLVEEDPFLSDDDQRPGDFDDDFDDDPPDGDVEPEPEEKPPNCEGGFSEPVELFRDEGWVPQALTPTRDGLEFFYARMAFSLATDPSGIRHVMVRRRASKAEPFGEPEEIAATIGACELSMHGSQPAAVDLSQDMLRLYVGCNVISAYDDNRGPLLVFERANRQSPFVLRPEPAGQIGVSIGLTRDELHAYGTSLSPYIKEVLYYSRNSIDEAFGEPVIAPGAPSFFNPEPAPDGLSLLGAYVPPAFSDARLVMVRRKTADEPFGPMETEGLPEPWPGYSDYSPALGYDCRTLAFLRVSYSPTFDAMVMVAGR